MSKTKLEKIVVRVLNNHPTGTRNRAGFQFGFSPSVVEVTPEQKAIIEADQYLKIVTAGTALEQGLDNPAPTVESIVNPSGTNPEGTPDGDPANPDGDPATPPEKKPISRMTKAELVAELVEKGLEAGKDFDPEAKNDDLIALLTSL